MTKKKTEPVAAIQDALQYLKSEAQDVGASDLAFYIGTAIEAAEEFVVSHRLKG